MIVRNIVEKHQTNVNLVSEVGVGTTFWFDLAVFEEETVLITPYLKSDQKTYKQQSQ